jgi:formiminotetrahydrofolate cyclodeaminase
MNRYETDFDSLQRGHLTMNRAAEPLAELSLAELLAEFAARTPAPGGGSAAAVACSLAAALVEMAAGFDPAGDPDQTGARAAELRAYALELAERDRHSYEPVLEALALPREDAERARVLAAARAGASDAPLAIAGVGAELASLAAEAAAGGSPHLHGDAVAAVLLAEGACRAAVRLVELNLAGAPKDSRLRQASELARVAAASRGYVLATVPDRSNR